MSKPETIPQVQVYAWQRAARSALVTAVTMVPTMLVVVPLITDSAKGFLPPGLYAKFAAIGAAVVLVATLITRVIADPRVDRFLHTIGFGVVPKSAVDQTIVVAVKNAAAAAAAVQEIERVAASAGKVPGLADARTTTPTSLPVAMPAAGAQADGTASDADTTGL